jgi:hypothetical protein
MIQGLTGEEKQRLSTIIFNNIPESAVTVRHSDPEERKKLQSILAQKIAYETVVLGFKDRSRTHHKLNPLHQTTGVKTPVFACFPST